MEFWDKLNTVLKQKGFSITQIKKIQEVFGHLDAAGILLLSPGQLLPAMTGRTVAEKMKKIETLLLALKEVQAQSDADPDEAVVIIGHVTGIPGDIPWETLSVRLFDQKRTDRGGSLQAILPNIKKGDIMHDDTTKAVWTHGHHLEVEHPDRTTGILRRGRSVLVEGANDQHTWLHGTIATPTGVSSERICVWVRSRSIGEAEITAIHVWDGDQRIGRIDNLWLSSQEYTATPLEICLTKPIQWGIGISIRVKFGQASNTGIEISAIGCEFAAQCPPAQFQINPAVVASERFPVFGNNTTLYLPFASQFEQCAGQFFTFNSRVRRIVISLHGVGANANMYCRRMALAASDAGASDNSLIVAPQFMNLNRENTNEVIDKQEEVLSDEDDLMYWNGGRFVGSRSSNEENFPRKGGERISSFTIIDRMLEHCVHSNLFPNLEIIVLAGHSGGGQFINRYAASSVFTPPAHVQLRYIPMNPGAYMYLSDKRYHPPTPHPVSFDKSMSFASPDEAALEYALNWEYVNPKCFTSDSPTQRKADLLANYDNYSLGLTNVMGWQYHQMAYNDQPDAATQMRANYRNREIIHLVGEKDNNPDAGDLPKCPPNFLQGRSRLERARIYIKHLIHEDIWKSSNHVFQEVEGVGHNGEKMMRSDDGLWYIFGDSILPTVRSYVSALDQLKYEVWMLKRFLDRMRTRQPTLSGGQHSESAYIEQLRRTRTTLRSLRQEIERPTGRYPEPPEIS